MYSLGYQFRVNHLRFEAKTDGSPNKKPCKVDVLYFGAAGGVEDLRISGLSVKGKTLWIPADFRLFISNRPFNMSYIMLNL